MTRKSNRGNESGDGGRAGSVPSWWSRPGARAGLVWDGPGGVTGCTGQGTGERKNKRLGWESNSPPTLTGAGYDSGATPGLQPGSTSHFGRRAGPGGPV